MRQKEAVAEVKYWRSDGPLGCGCCGCRCLCFAVVAVVAEGGGGEVGAGENGIWGWRGLVGDI